MCRFINMKYIGFLFLLLASVANLCGQSDFNRAKMDSLLNVYEQKNKLMLTLAISQDGNTVYKRATGYSWIVEDKKTLANSETKYRIGSISKTFTAVMILQLVEEKKIKLSFPLSKY